MLNQEPPFVWWCKWKHEIGVFLLPCTPSNRGLVFENVMKVHECMEISRPVLEAMRRAGVRLDDVRYLDMYKRFLSMKRDCLKVTYIAEKLSEEYNIKPRQFYYIVKKMESVIE